MTPKTKLIIFSILVIFLVNISLESHKIYQKYYLAAYFCEQYQVKESEQPQCLLSFQQLFDDSADYPNSLLLLTVLAGVFIDNIGSLNFLLILSIIFVLGSGVANFAINYIQNQVGFHLHYVTAQLANQIVGMTYQPFRICIFILLAHLLVSKGKKSISAFVSAYSLVIMASELGIVIPIYLQRETELLNTAHIYNILTGVNLLIVVLTLIMFRFKKALFDEQIEIVKEYREYKSRQNISQLALSNQDGSKSEIQTVKINEPGQLNNDRQVQGGSGSQPQAKAMSTVLSTKNPLQENWFLLNEDNFNNPDNLDIYHLIISLDIPTIILIISLGYVGAPYYFIWRSAQIFRDASLTKSGVFYLPLTLITICGIFARYISWTKVKTIMFQVICLSILVVGLIIQYLYDGVLSDNYGLNLLLVCFSSVYIAFSWISASIMMVHVSDLDLTNIGKLAGLISWVSSMTTTVNKIYDDFYVVGAMIALLLIYAFHQHRNDLRAQSKALIEVDIDNQEMENSNDLSRISEQSIKF